MRNHNAKNMALGGLMAALAVVIMCLGGLIPVATYVCCVLCMILCAVVMRFCGKRVAIVWYVAVSILGLLLGADKEAAALFAVLGYYPVIKFFFEKYRLGVILKFLYFNIVIILFYIVMIYLLGLQNLGEEFHEFGRIGVAIMLVLGNVTFIVLDKLLRIVSKMR